MAVRIVSPAREEALYSAPDLRLKVAGVFADIRRDFNRTRNGCVLVTGESSAVPVKNAAFCIKVAARLSPIIPAVRDDMSSVRIQETRT